MTVFVIGGTAPPRFRWVASRRGYASCKRHYGAGYHVAKHLAVPNNITLVPLPPYAPELNPVENVWEYLRGNKLSIAVFDGYDDIVEKSCTAWSFFANDPNCVKSITTRAWARVNR